tara:strand:+ start:5647 stop:6102 length:456 start_codon:yes stop_codon:yes gene_type:complete
LKVRTLEEVKELVKGKRVVSTNGVFDILHVGHLKYLQEAKKLGDVLVIGVNSDESVKRYKGDKRPLNDVDSRMELLAGLECVDYVFSFNEDDPRGFLKVLKPSIHVKAGDYTLPLVESGVVEENCGKVKILDFVDGRSTSDIIEKVLDAYS